MRRERRIVVGRLEDNDGGNTRLMTRARGASDDRPMTKQEGKIPSGEKPTPGRSAPLVLNTTEDHDATSRARRRRMLA
jgi:hypothetical protein